MRHRTSLLFAVLLLASCGHSKPTVSESESAVKAILNQVVNINGVDLPADTYTLDSINVVAMTKHMVSDIPHYSIKATVAVTLTKGGSDIGNEIQARAQRTGGPQAALQLGSFGDGMGFLLQKGTELDYNLDVDLVHKGNGYAVDAGHWVQANGN